MDAKVVLTADQVKCLAPVLGLQGTRVLVAAVHPNGTGWQLDIHALPGERRDAIRAACAGTLTLPRPRKPKAPKQAAKSGDRDRLLRRLMAN